MPRNKVVSLLNTEEVELLRLNRQVLDESPDLIAIIGSDYIYCYVNPAYVRVHAKKAEDYIGHHVKEFLGEDTFTRVVKPNFDRCFQGENVRYEEWFDFGSSGIMYMEVEYIRLPGGQGTSDSIAIISHNMTSVKEWEETRLNQEKFKTVIDTVRTKNGEITDSLCSIGGYLQILLIGETDPEKIHYLEKSIIELQTVGELNQTIGQTVSTHSNTVSSGVKALNIHQDCKGTA